MFSLLAGACNIGVLCFFLIAYVISTQQLVSQQRDVTEAVARLFDAKFADSRKTLNTLAPLISATDGDIVKARTIINNHVTRLGQSLRIAWSDNHQRLRVGTMVGVFASDKVAVKVMDDPIDLAHRDYINHAVAHPGVIAVSGVMPHAVTGRMFFAIAIGVVGKEKQYLGCLASIVDVLQLQDLFRAVVADKPIVLTVDLSNGSRIFSSHNDAPAIRNETVERADFHITSGLLKEAVFDIQKELFKKFLMVLVISNLGMVGIFAIMYRYYIAPLKELANTFLDLPANLAPVLTQGDDELTMIIGRASAIKDLLVQYRATQEEASYYLENLRQAVALIRNLQDEQTAFLSTVSAEMQETFTAIQRYAGFLEGELNEDFYHTDSYFQEHLKDSAQNLKFLSNAFYLMCLHKSGTFKLTNVPVGVWGVIEHVLALFRDVITYRNITLKIERGDGTLELDHDESIIRHIVWGIFFITMKYVDDDGVLAVTLHQEGKILHMTVQASAVMEGLLPQVDSDMAPFFPKSLDKTHLLEQILLSHVNYRVVHYLLMHFGGGVEVKVIDSHAENCPPGFKWSIKFTPFKSSAHIRPPQAAKPVQPA